MFSSVKTHHGLALLLSAFILAIILIGRSWNEFVLVADQTIQTIQSIPSSASWHNTQLAQVASALEGPGSGLVGWWKFDEGSGTTAADASGNGNNGTLVGGPTWTTASKVGSGALQFDGVNDYITIPDSASISSIEGSNQVTIALWIKRNSTAPIYLVSRYNYSNLFSIHGDSNWDLRPWWRYGGSGSGGTTLDHSGCDACLLSVGRWHHVVAIYNNPTSYIYVDGKLISSRDGTGGALNTGSTDPLLIGNYASLYMNGSLDDVRIYSRALSATEVQQLYTLGGDAPSPINGSCGSAAKQYGSADSFPSGVFCSSGTANPASPSDPAQGSSSSWTCDGSSGGSTASCTATRSLPGATTYTLTVSKSGTGQGTVTGTGINCGSDCAETQNQGTVITLTATPTSGSTFQGWSGACTGTDTCAVILNSNTSITAIFNTQTTTGPTTYTVKKDGTGNYTTIQACADVAKAGDTCLVYPGNYPERVDTKFGGTSSNPSTCVPVVGTYPNLVSNSAICDAQRITFKANGLVTMQGFWIRHPYVTVEGFDITGIAPVNSGYINVMPANPYWGNPGGHYCEILNNTIRDGATAVMGIFFAKSPDNTPSANYCVVRGNTIRNLTGDVFILTRGSFNLFENNRLEKLNNMNFIYLFGHDLVFRGNVFLNGNSVVGVGIHPDWIQTWGNGDGSYNMLFEQNWVQDLEAAMGQLDSGGGATGIQSDIHDYLFRNNVLVNVLNNWSIEVPGVRFEHNTFYRTAYDQNGVNLSGSLTRGDIRRAFLENNAFVANGSPNDIWGSRGWYEFFGVAFTMEVTKTFVTDNNDTISLAIANDMVANGYLLTPNGELTDKARALSNISQFVMGQSFINYKPTVYNLFAQTVILDISARNTFHADYNFVTGAQSDGFPSKVGFIGKEIHGINGGNPKFQNINNPLGPDGIPFTLDDGLKPLPGSPLCEKGVGGTDIGVYSCDPNIVLDSGGQVPSFSVNGSCSATLNQCIAGTFSDTTDTSTNYLWQCLGSNGGTTASCSLPITPIAPSTPTIGDFNNDGMVNSIDLSLMITAWNTNNTTYDLNRDGRVNSLDYVVMVRNWTM